MHPVRYITTAQGIQTANSYPQLYLRHRLPLYPCDSADASLYSGQTTAISSIFKDTMHPFQSDPAPKPHKTVIQHYYPNGNPDAPLNPPGARNTDSCLPLNSTGEVTHNYATKEPAPGDIAFRWIHGSISAATNKDPRIQVLQYNEDTYILRENPCIHWEAPFTYLLFGNTGALLIDTGATKEAEWYPLRKTVDAIVRRWCSIRQPRKRRSIR